MLNTKPKQNRIDQIQTNGYQLDFGTVFESAFENYKKIALYAGLMLLVYSIVAAFILLAGIVSYIGIENIENFSNKMKEFSQLKVMPLKVTLLINAGVIIYSTIVAPFMAGFLKMAHCGEKGAEFQVSSMFSYYKSPYLFNIMIAVIIISIFSNGLAMLLEYTGLSFVGTLITMLISFLTFLSMPLIVFGNLNAAAAIKSSIIIVSKQPLTLLALLIVAGITAFLGVFGFCFGVFFTWPFMNSMNYIIYKTIIGIDDDSEFDTKTGIEN